MSRSKQTIAIIVGFSEGKWHSKRFVKALRANGYRVTSVVSDADIVITHSAGCYYVPQLEDRQRLIMINPTYWPGKSRVRRGRDLIHDYLFNVLPSKRGPYMLVKTFWNFFYLATQPARTRDIIRRSAHYNLQESIRHHNTTIIRNENDPWIRPNLENLQTTFPKLKIYHLPGDHDDCWYQPLPYINLLQSDR